MKNTDGISVTAAVANDLGIPIGSTLSYALSFLDTQHESLVTAIKDSSNFVKTQDFTKAGTHTFKASGTKAIAIIVGGGGGGGGGGRPSGSGAGGGGGGGGAGKIIITDIININRNATYNVVVGASGEGGSSFNSCSSNYRPCGGYGGTSSVFSVTADGGKGGESGGALASQGTTYEGYGGAGGTGGASGGKGGTPGGSSVFSQLPGGTGSAAIANKNDYSYTAYSGGGGGAGAVFRIRSDGTIYTNIDYTEGGSSSSGGGSGRRGGYFNKTISATAYPGMSGVPATGYGCGGGGGGGGGLHYVSDPSDDNSPSYTNAGNGGSGYRGRVIIYESGVFNV